MRAAFSIIRVCLMAVAIGALSAAALGEGFDDTLSRDAVLRDPEIPALGNPDGDLTGGRIFRLSVSLLQKARAGNRAGRPRGRQNPAGAQRLADLRRGVEIGRTIGAGGEISEQISRGA